ncbi:MAG: class II fumarate hydratase [Spirochaetales bacterium]|nr:class II fumarate hydratase [Spirochaetales bacterium]
MSKRTLTHRTESDSFGSLKLPDWSYWGAQTERAVNNFTVSPLRIPLRLLEALVLIKRSAAETNTALGLLDKQLSQAIVKAASEIMEGNWDEHFPVDVFQTGSGTSWNMNVNEVIANRANEILGEKRGKKYPVHPNDHVNMGQSSNDVIPSAINISNRLELERLKHALKDLEKELKEKAARFKDIIKIGRTHLQDAVPLTLGQEFSGYLYQIKKNTERILSVFSHLEELPLGGTAVGTGINTHPQFATAIIKRLAGYTKVPFREAENKFQAIAARDVQVELMGTLNTLSCSLMKIANDLRFLSSGPRAGICEIELPPLQPGSSIMPGKVNPVIPEMVIQVCAHIMGKAVSVSIAGQTGPLDLQIMQPLIAYETLSSLELLTNTITVLAGRCIKGLKACPENCNAFVEKSLALVTPLALKIGYDKAAKIAQRAYRENKTVKQIALEEGVVTAQEVKIIFDPKQMLGPT